MIKIDLIEVEHKPYSKLDTYDSINRIPFNLRIGMYDLLPTPVYFRNLYGESFIEFRFDINNLTLYEITLIAIEEKEVAVFGEGAITKKKGNFMCKLSNNTEFILNVPMTFYRSETSICICLDNEFPSMLEYFEIADNCFIGVNQEFQLSSVLLENLKKKQVFEIFGF